MRTFFRYALLITFLPSLLYPCQKDGLLHIFVLNVGQGDATLILAPDNTTFLIDAGDNGLGASVVLPFLQGLGIMSLKYVIATHYDSDHIGGLDEVLNVIGSGIEKVYDKGDARNSKSSTLAYRRYVTATGNKRSKIPLGQLYHNDSFSITCIAVDGAILNSTTVPLDAEDENSASVVLLVSFKDFAYYTGGDLTGGGPSGSKKTRDVESRAAVAVGDVDAMKLNHHGSITSTNSTLLNVLRPEVVLISIGNGGKNQSGFHHPSQEVLARLFAFKGLQAIYQTNLGESLRNYSAEDYKLVRIANGHLKLETDGASYAINGETFPDDQHSIRSATSALTYAASQAIKYAPLIAKR